MPFCEWAFYIAFVVEIPFTRMERDFSMERRRFLQSALVGTAVLSSTGAGILFSSCKEQSLEAKTEFIPDVELVLTAAPDEEALLPGRPTPVWRFRNKENYND